MKRIYPSKFGQYYSTKDEQEPRKTWLLIAAIFYVIILAGVVSLVLADGVTPWQPKATAGEGA